MNTKKKKLSSTKHNIGETIKKTRQKKKITLKQLSEITKVDVATIKHIENNNFECFSNQAYIRAFLITICEILDLDNQDIFSLIYEQKEIKTQFENKQKKNSFFLYSLFGFILIISLIILFYITKEEKKTYNKNKQSDIQKDSLTLLEKKEDNLKNILQTITNNNQLKVSPPPKQIKKPTPIKQTKSLLRIYSIIDSVWVNVKRSSLNTVNSKLKNRDSLLISFYDSITIYSGVKNGISVLYRDSLHTVKNYFSLP